MAKLQDVRITRLRAALKKIPEILRVLCVPALLTVLVSHFNAQHCLGQIQLRGMVVDSITMQSLSDVNITIKSTGPTVVSDLRGGFTLQATERDTIIFSRIGYITRVVPADVLSRMALVLLKEESRMLDSIVIEEKRPSWLPEMAPQSPWQNQTVIPREAETPGLPTVQTFGPGYVIKGPFSRLSKEEKEKKKLQQVREENYRARNYVALVNDPEVKDKIMKDYRLSEDDYYAGLAKFNEVNHHVIYTLESDDVIKLLVQFFSQYDVARK